MQETEGETMTMSLEARVTLWSPQQTAERIGLQPFAAPDPLPPIQPDEVHLICWLAIERANEQ